MYQFRASDALTEARTRQSLDRSYAVGLPVLAVLLFVLSTRHGIGIWPDSTRYMGLSPQPWDAPLYPALLRLVAASGIDIAVAAWAIGLVLAALNPLLTWHLLREAGGRTAPAALGTALIVIAPQSVSFHGLAMSEPLFLTTILASLLAFMYYLRTDDRRWLIATGIAVGLASLARFTGPALGAAFALFLLIDPRHGLSRRLADVARILIPSALLFLGWAGISEEISGRSTGRPLEWLGNMTAADWRSSFEALTAWIVPDNVPEAIRGALFLAALAAGLAVIAYQGRHALGRAKQGQPDASLLVIPLGFFFFAYLGFMVLATSIEANLHLNSRYAYPIYCTSVMAVSIALAGVQSAPVPVRRLGTVLVGIACLMLVGHGVRTAYRTYQAYRDGVGYASLSWTRSPTLAAVARLPKDAVLYSNGADAIGYVLRRPARNIPAHIELRTGREEPEAPYAAQLADARATLGRGNAYVIFLNGITWRFYQASERELVDRLNLVREARLADGAIYRSAGNGLGDEK